ncbi:MAG: LamG domain-containing protein [Candidatus Aenigmatarchaeota archaeon]
MKKLLALLALALVLFSLCIVIISAGMLDDFYRIFFGAPSGGLISEKNLELYMSLDRDYGMPDFGIYSFFRYKIGLVDGTKGNGYYFNSGYSSNIRFETASPANKLFHITDAITLMAWVKHDSPFQSYGYITGSINEEGFMGRPYVLQSFDHGSDISLAHRYKFSIENSDNDVFTLSIPYRNSLYYTSGRWDCVAATYDSNVATDNARIYRDGKLVAMGTFQGKIKTYDSTNKLYIGKNFNGTLDEVRIYSRALGAQEITDWCSSFDVNIPLTTETTILSALSGSYGSEQDAGEQDSLLSAITRTLIDADMLPNGQ